jgi:hypothetical protein
MKSWLALSFSLLLAASLRAQATQTAQPPDNAKPASAELAADAANQKPDPKKQAKDLLDAAAEMVSSVQPQVQVVALMHIAESYRVLDRARSLELLQQAFQDTAVLAVDSGHDWRSELQAQIAQQATKIDLNTGIGMLKQIVPASDAHDPRGAAINEAVSLMMQRQQFDSALELIESAGSTGAYPYDAVGMVMSKLPTDDPRRAAAFRAALSAFVNHPDAGFGQLVARHWREAPEYLAKSAIESLVDWILDSKDDRFMTKSLATSRGAVTLKTRQAADLFDVMSALRAVDPARADDVLNQYPDLRMALAYFPEGTQSMVGSDGSLSTSTNTSSTGISQETQARQQMTAIAASRASAALAQLSESPQKALDAVRSIPLPDKQAEVLGVIAQSVSGKDPEAARSILSQCVSLLDSIQDPALRAPKWAVVAQAAYRAKDQQGAWAAIARGMNDASALYQLDSDGDRPNVALREYWPSTQFFRLIVGKAAELFGADAEALLGKIPDPELGLLARIEVAQVLLGSPSTVTRIDIDRRPK